MGRLGFFIALGICVVSLALAGGFWAFAHRGTDWTSPRLTRLEIQARILLFVAVFAGVCSVALYDWTY
jgi:hypothetical protein